MGLSYRLEPPILKQLKIQVFSDTSHEEASSTNITNMPKISPNLLFHCNGMHTSVLPPGVMQVSF